MFADQFRLKIEDESAIANSAFVVYYAEEGGAGYQWIMLAEYPSRMEAEAFIDGIEFRDANAI